MKENINKQVDDLLRKVNRENVYDFRTDYQKDLKEYVLKLLERIPNETKDLFNFYKLVYLNHILDIREQDALNVFILVFKNVVEFYLHLKSKYINENPLTKNTQ